MKEKPRMYNGVRTASSMSDAGKTSLTDRMSNNTEKQAQVEERSRGGGFYFLFLIKLACWKCGLFLNIRPFYSLSKCQHTYLHTNFPPMPYHLSQNIDDPFRTMALDSASSAAFSSVPSSNTGASFGFGMFSLLPATY